jgi:hypothetical protein
MAMEGSSGELELLIITFSCCEKAAIEMAKLRNRIRCSLSFILVNVSGE